MKLVYSMISVTVITGSSVLATGLSSISDEIQAVSRMVGAILMALLLLVIVFQLDQQHFLLKILSMFFAITSMILIPALMLYGSGESTQLAYRGLPITYMILLSIYIFMMLVMHWLKTSISIIRIFPGLRKWQKNESSYGLTQK